MRIAHMTRVTKEDRGYRATYMSRSPVRGDNLKDETKSPTNLNDAPTILNRNSIALTFTYLDDLHGRGVDV